MDGYRDEWFHRRLDCDARRDKEYKRLAACRDRAAHCVVNRAKNQPLTSQQSFKRSILRLSWLMSCAMGKVAQRWTS